MRRILVTGFGPFPGVAVNPTTQLVEAIAAESLPGIATRLLPTTWQVCADVAAAAPAFDGVVMFGVAAPARRIRYERVALPDVTAAPDAAGAMPSGRRLSYRASRLPVPMLAKAARRAGFPVRVSHSPGRYICNAAYGAALANNPKTLFVHIPLPNRHGPLSADGLVRHALWLVDRLSQHAPGQAAIPARRTAPPPPGQAGLRGW